MNVSAPPRPARTAPAAPAQLAIPLERIRRPTAIALLATALFAFAGIVATPHDDGTTASFLAALAAHPGRTQVGDLLLHVAWVAAALACFGLALLGLATRRGPLLLAGCVLAALGLTTLPGLFATDAYDLAIAQELPRALGIAVSEQAASTPLAAVLFISASLGAALGPPLLLAALWRGGLLSVAAPALTIAGPVLAFAGGSGTTAVLGVGILSAGYALAAVELLRRP